MFIEDISKLSHVSFAKIKVKCIFCDNIRETEYKVALDIINKNDGKFMCKDCFLLSSQDDIELFKCIDTPEKAYLIGCCSTNFTETDKDVIYIKPISNSFQWIYPIQCIVKDRIKTSLKNNEKYFEITDPSILNVIVSDNILDKIPNDYLKWIFIRGVFETYGNVTQPLSDNDIPTCYIKSNSELFLQNISNYINIPCSIKNETLEFHNTNAIDFLGKIYTNPCAIKNKTKYDNYMKWLSKTPSGILPLCSVFKTDVHACIPSKAKESDAGYDLTIIKVAKKFSNMTTLYDTGIQINVSHGFYAEVVPRSSLSKSGYMLANSIGIIDNSYRNNIFIALTKIDPDAPDLELPFRCCQLIFRKQINMIIQEVVEPFDKTTRNTGGFGSSG